MLDVPFSLMTFREKPRLDTTSVLEVIADVIKSLVPSFQAILLELDYFLAEPTPERLQ